MIGRFYEANKKQLAYFYPVAIPLATPFYLDKKELSISYKI